KWLEAERDAETIRRFLDEHIFGVRDFFEYLERCGGLPRLQHPRQQEVLLAPPPPPAPTLPPGPLRLPPPGQGFGPPPPPEPARRGARPQRRDTDRDRGRPRRRPRQVRLRQIDLAEPARRSGRADGGQDRGRRPRPGEHDAQRAGRLSAECRGHDLPGVPPDP